MKILMILLILTFSLQATPPKKDKILYTNLIGSASILTWGILNWDYGKREMHTTSEGWFEKDTKYRGIDKLGHFYTTFALSNFFAKLYQGFGYEKSCAIKQGAISSFMLNTVMEVGDSFSSYGFSHEDFIVNALGSYVGYYLLTHPEVDKIVDIRIEYKPSKKITSGDSYDILTDYDGMKFLTVVKLDGFKKLEDSFLKYLEFGAGYYTRRENGKIEPYPYAMIGINFSKLLKPVSKRVSKVFEYYQMPFGYVEFK
jgi:VanZ family protein